MNRDPDTDRRATSPTIDGDGRVTFDPTFDVFVEGPAPRLGGPALHEFAPDEADRELVADVSRFAQSAASAPPATAALLRYAPIVPDRARVRLVTSAAARAAVCGLDLPIVLVRFIEAPAHVPRGLASGMFPCCCRITVRADVSLHELPGLMLHELQHVADIHAGAWERMAVEERERRAIVFQIRASEGWALNS